MTDSAAGTDSRGLPCLLCGSALPAGGGGYCCSGCRRVAEILEAAGYQGDPRDSRSFRAALQAGLLARPVDLGERAPAAEPPDAWRELAVELEGLWCPSCAWLVESVLSATPGVLDCRVAFLTDRAEIRYDPSVVGEAAVAGRIESLGYRLRRAGEPPANRELLVRFGAAAVLTANAMMFSYAYYVHRASAAPEGAAQWLPWLLAAMAVAVVFGAGGPVLRRGLAALRAGMPTMDTLVATASSSALIFSVAAAARGQEDLYFDVSCALIAFWLLGRLLEQSVFRTATAPVEAIRRLLPRKARRLRGETAEWVDPSLLVPGDWIRVEPGERVPADGRVLGRPATVSTAVVDGEPRPRTVPVGGTVPAGSGNGPAPLDLEVMARADASMLARVADHVAHSAAARGRPREFTDALAVLVLYGVLALAVLTGASCLRQNASWSEAFERALSVLVVSCPCALAVAAPLARVNTATALARAGLVARQDGVLDELADARRIAFDKTGTLTEGAMTLSLAAWEGVEPAEALAALAALECHVDHPIAHAACRAVDLAALPSVCDVLAADGCGISGLIGAERARAGRPGWVEEQCGRAMPPELRSAVEGVTSRGATPVALALGARGWAVFGFGDTLRPEALAVVAELEALGLRTAVLSGDDPRSTAAVASQAGIGDASGGMLPEQKARWLSAAGKADGARPLFVGDGINDAPALAASAGIAVAGGTDFARETAAVLMLEPNLSRLPGLIVAARRARRVARQNLAWALGYNLLAIPMAVCGQLDPIVAAAAMIGSSLIVNVNSLQLARPAARTRTAS